MSLDSWWYDDVDIYTFDDAGTDWYRITGSTVEHGFGSQGGWNFIGDIVYHEVFDPNVVAQYFPQRGKHSEDLVGSPAGVFIIGYQDDRQPTWVHNGLYMGVYYWGRGATGSPTGGGP